MQKKKTSPKKEPEKPKAVMGRPLKFTKELATKICDIVSTTPDGLNKICRVNEDFPTPETIRVWRLKDADFSAEYARAKLAQAEILTEQCLDLADDCGTMNWMQARLQIDTRKWLASKMLPRQYGDKYVFEQKDEETEKFKQQVIELRAELAEKYKKEY